MDLDDAAEELYAVAPGEFLTTRKGLVARAREEGDRPLSQEIGKLRRPTVAAWLVNQLVREEEAGADVDRLVELGDEMRAAQADGSGPKLRELTQERRSLVAGLIEAADDVGERGGQNVTPAVQRELEETLGAAVADPTAADAVASGRLTRALAYAGFGDVDLSEAVAAPTRRPRLRVVREGERAPARREPEPQEMPDRQAEADEGRERKEREKQRERERAEAREAVEEAEHTLSGAEDEVAAGERRRSGAQERQENAEHDTADLERRLKEARAELSEATDELRAADRELRRREREERDARTALRRAEAALERVEED